MTLCNAEVRAFAERHRLLTTVREDGEVALRIGRRRTDTESHASLGLPGSGWWKVYAYHATAFVAAALREAGAGDVEHLDDGMVVASVREESLFRVLDCSARTRVVRVKLPPVHLAAARARSSVGRKAS